MRNSQYFLVGIFCAAAFAEAIAIGAYSPSTIITDPAGVNQANVKPSGTPASGSDKALVVAISPNNTVPISAPSALPISGTTTANQGTPGPTSSPWPVSLPSGVPIQVTGSFYPATQPVSIASPVPITAPSALPVAVVSPLPAGTNSIGSVVQGTPGPTSSPWPVTLVSPNPLPVTAASPLPFSPVGGATDSQTTGTVSTVITLTAPSNAQGFILQNLQTSTANVRFALGATATTTLGMELAPGQDSGFFPTSANVSLCSESGTQNYNVQWIAK